MTDIILLMPSIPEGAGKRKLIKAVFFESFKIIMR